ncbi:MAG TPA: efflux transporter outer membrane subunit [Caulobacteraceae bacterium]|jgi:NodT family efflux transporter outer membrane factor (OMF) lipoprotein|nr:efflux transporter outer membrane subunit [Caulobacteraceae bacterium]
MSGPRQHHRTLALGLLATAGVLALAACATPPGHEARPQLADVASYQDQASFAAPSADWPNDRWWDAYGDTQLSALIDEAVKGSPTLAQAEARLTSAGAQTQVARAADLPQISASGSVTEAETSRVEGFPPFIQELLPKGYLDNGRLAIDASFDLDLFGKNRAALAASVSEEAATRADLAEARLTLSSAVAMAYADLMRLGAERGAAAEALRNRGDTARLAAERVQNGLDTRAELKQAEAATPASQADVDSLDEQILLTRHRIAALLGEGPDRGLAIALPTAEAVKPFGLPADLRLHLIGRRPDIVAARLRAEAAGKRIDVARAQFYPDISLTGYIGQQSLGISQLFNPAAAIGSIGPTLTLPIFQGGRLRGQYHGARADYAAAVDAYDATLTQALQDVADAGASVQSAQKQLADRKAALDAGEAAYSVARERYEGGLSDYVAVLTAENAVIDERRAFADAQTRVFSLDIALVRALGGGYAGA